MTEPNTAGSDPTLLTTSAVRDGDEWVINGHKWFTSNGSVADFLIVMAVTNPDVHPYQGSSMIIVPVGHARGRHRAGRGDDGGSPRRRSGASATTPRSCTATSGCRPGTWSAGRARASRWRSTGSGPGRIHHCMRWLGQSRRAFDMLCERAVSRYAHGSMLAEKQTIQNWVADSMAEMQAARLMTLQAAWKMDQEGAAAARVEIAMIKYFGAKVLYDVIDRAIQVHGSLGFSCDLPLESMYRAARAARIYDGPDEVHRQTVARQVLKGFVAHEVPSEHIPTRRAEAQRRFADLLETLTVDV